MAGRKGFMSAWGCCARCGKVVSCRAPDRESAVGSRPYVHKWRRGSGGGWCDGHEHPALHYTESDEFDEVRTIQQIDAEVAEGRHLRRGG